MIQLPSVRALCVYADSAGVSHLIDVALPALAQVVDERGKTHFRGAAGATVIGFVAGTGKVFKDWHVATMPGLSITLSGRWEIEAGSGERRMLEAGSVLLMLDTRGQGHRSRCDEESGSTVIGIGIDEATRTAFAALVERAIGEGRRG